jgi:hypothetical protein
MAAEVVRELVKLEILSLGRRSRRSA